jgi:RHS repeat-associated protein
VAGNLTATPFASMTYDPEGRVKTFQSATLSVNSGYGYDAEGQRVKATVGGTQTVYVYDATGQLAAEYGGTVTASGTQYLTADHLGSTRLVTAAGGVVQERHDFAPFGEEVAALGCGEAAGSVLRSPRCDIAGYGIGGVRIKFTGKERDAETGLDYFGARYFSSPQGRFTSPDRPFADQNPADPQSWNLYTYGRNNPLRFFDPSGMEAVSKEDCAKDSTCVSAQLNIVLDKNADIYDSKGNLLPQYQKQVDAQIAKAQSDYGEFNIHLEVTTVSGEVTNNHGKLSISSGELAGALNVAVTDSNELGNSAMTGASQLRNGVAETFLNIGNIKSDTLSHELAHQFSGDTAFQIPNIRVPVLNQLVGFAIGLGANVYTDYRNDYTRAFPGGVPWTAPRPVSVPGFPANWGMFNRGARRWAQW